MAASKVLARRAGPATRGSTGRHRGDESRQCPARQYHDDGPLLALCGWNTQPRTRVVLYGDANAALEPDGKPRHDATPWIACRQHGRYSDAESHLLLWTPRQRRNATPAAAWTRPGFFRAVERAASRRRGCWLSGRRRARRSNHGGAPVHPIEYRHEHLWRQRKR